MFFYDLENFRKSLIRINPTSFYDIGKFQFFLISFLCEKLKFAYNNESLIRTYAYTGEYTDNIIKKMKKEMEEMSDLKEKERRKEFLEKSQKKYEHQQRQFNSIKKLNFFELRTTPLKYENNKVFQKGVDVQLAVDLVAHAFQDNFDTAVICSGDIDLIESIKIVKNLGKRVLLGSHPNLASRKLRESADFFIDFSKFTQEQLDLFSTNFIKNKKI